MSKARDLADLGSNDVLETTSTGVDVTGTVTADGATFDGYVTVNNSMDLNGALFPDSIFMMDSKPVVFGSDTDVEVFWGGSYLNLQTKGNDIRIMDGLDTKVIWDASAESLGIGTSSPNAKADLVGGDVTGGLKISQDTTTSAFFSFGADANETRITSSSYGGYKPLTVHTGGTERMRIDASGNVGIGTTSPTGKLSVFGDSSRRTTLHGDHIAIGLNTAGEGGWRTGYAFDDSSNNELGGVMAWGNGNSMSKMGFEVAGAERMRIDSAGRVTMPYQPSFYVGLNSSAVFYNANVIFNTTDWFPGQHNTGGHYNTSTGLFTAPVAGRYHFHAKLIYQDMSNTDMSDCFWIMVNGVQAGYSDKRSTYYGGITGTGNYYTDTVTMTFNLAANDTVAIQSRRNIEVHGNAKYCVFMGHLIG